VASASDGDKIVFDFSGTIGLTTGEVQIDQDIEIDGENQIAIETTAEARIFNILSDVDVTIRNTTLQRSPISVFPVGGGIENRGNLTVIDCEFLNNVAISGSGVFNNANLVVEGCLFQNNDCSTSNGGGIRNSDNASLTVSDSVFEGNSGYYGGGIFNRGNAKITNSTIRDNLAFRASGGGIWNEDKELTISNCSLHSNQSTTGGGGLANKGGTVSVEHSTISGNTTRLGYTSYSSKNGGGIYNGAFGEPGIVRLDSCTVYDNFSHANGGGIYVRAGKAEIGNTVLGGNEATEGFDAWGLIVSNDYNLIQDTQGLVLTGCMVHSLSGFAPLLDVLADNGGDTLTHLPLNESPVINAGRSARNLDQRGEPRVVGPWADIGAVERQILSGNQPPLLSLIANQAVQVDSALSSIPLKIVDPESNFEDLTLEFLSSNPALVPASGISLDQSSGTLSVVPQVGETGETIITVKVTDEVGDTTQVSFRLRVVQNLDQQIQEALAWNIEYLKDVMDKYHRDFWVYDDVSEAGNHFHAVAKFPNASAPVDANGSWPIDPYSGATCIRCEFTPQGANGFGGIFMVNGLLPPNTSAPLPYFGTSSTSYIDNDNKFVTLDITDDQGLNLSGATALRFFAKGETGGEKIEFFFGGIGRDPETGASNQPFPSSIPRTSTSPVVTTLSSEWQEITIDLAGFSQSQLENIMCGFGWGTNDTQNTNGAVFYLDEIRFELSDEAREARLNQPRFLRSFTTLPIQPDPFDQNPDDDLDLVFRNLAFTYDNALAGLAFLAEGSSDCLLRARLVGDAFVYAANHDRTYTDGRIRTAYVAGDIALGPGWMPNGLLGTVPIPGYFADSNLTFFEVEQDSVDVGNNAWAMLFLLGLVEKTGEQQYLDAATRIAEFITQFRQDTGTYQGFTGGFNSPETGSPELRKWASTEHNLDLVAAFTSLAQLTKDPTWIAHAEHARSFVNSMWDPGSQCFLAGTANDPDIQNRSPGQLPLDTQSWTVLALNNALIDHPQMLQCAERYHRVSELGLSGFDFNEDCDGIWLEGTAQMAIASLFAGDTGAATDLLLDLREAQMMSDDLKGTFAALHDGVSSGFGFSLFRRLHIGATAWSVFAQTGYNPFYYVSAVDPVEVDDLLFLDSNTIMLFLRGGSPGTEYLTFFSADLENWTPLEEFRITNGQRTIIEELPPTTSQRFYRLKCE